jgi:hypothetical protein
MACSYALKQAHISDEGRSYVMQLPHEREPPRIARCDCKGHLFDSYLGAHLRLNVDEVAELLDVAARAINCN